MEIQRDNNNQSNLKKNKTGGLSSQILKPIMKYSN